MWVKPEAFVCWSNKRVDCYGRTFQKNLLAVSILMASMSSFAADYTLSTSVTGTQKVDAPGTVTVASAGGVDCTHCGDSAMILVGDGFVSFSNAGALTGGDGGDGLSLALGSMSGDLVNTGTITAITPDLDLTEDGNSAVRLVYLNEPGAVGGFALRGKIINESSGEMSVSRS